MKAASTLAWPALLTLLLSGCSSSPSEAAATEAATNKLGSTQPPPTQPVCPGTTGEAMGAACDVEGQLCYPEYACGIAPALATCDCHSGHFACVDQLDAALQPDGAGGCPKTLVTPSCPASLGQAEGTACTQAGQLCTYASPCASIPAYVACQCVQLTQTDGGIYLGMQCDDTCAPGAPSAPTVDAGATGQPDANAPPDASQAPVDAAGDGPADATRAEAAAPDAAHE